MHHSWAHGIWKNKFFCIYFSCADFLFEACYGFIAMPVFVVGLLNTFIFNPMLYHMSVLWSEGQVKKFVLKTVRQTGIVVILTVVCIAGAWLLGVPVLSWLYNTDLAPYKTELLILLLGGRISWIIRAFECGYYHYQAPEESYVGIRHCGGIGIFILG